MFESIHKYVKELNAFLEELHAGLFIQQSMEKVFQDEEGKQLMVGRESIERAENLNC